MISNTELAKKWNLPVTEMHRIVTFADKYHFDVTRAYKMYRAVNRAFEVNVIKKNIDTQTYYGVLYQFDEYRQAKIIALSRGFETPSEAVKTVNEGILGKKIDWRTCYRLGVIPEAGELIKPVSENRFKIAQKPNLIAVQQQARSERS